MHLVGKEGGEPHWLSASSQPPRDQHRDGEFCAGDTGRSGLGMQGCREGGLPCHSPPPPVALHSSLKLGQRGQAFAPDLMQSRVTTVPGESELSEAVLVCRGDSWGDAEGLGDTPLHPLPWGKSSSSLGLCLLTCKVDENSSTLHDSENI